MSGRNDETGAGELHPVTQRPEHFGEHTAGTDEALGTVLAAAGKHAAALRGIGNHDKAQPIELALHATRAARRSLAAASAATAIPRDRVFSAFGRLFPDLEDYLAEHGTLPPPEEFAALCKTAVAESIEHPLPLIGRERAIADSLMSDLLKRCYGLVEGPYETDRGAYALVQPRADGKLTGHTFRIETSLNLAIARP